MFHPEDCEFDDAEHRVPLGLISNYHVKSTFKATAHMISNLLYLILKRHPKLWFNQINCLTLAEENFTNILFSFSEEIGGNYCDNTFFRKKFLFGTVYGMTKAPLLCVDISTYPGKKIHGGYYAY